LMSVPGIGVVSVLSYVSMIEDPARFTRSRHALPDHDRWARIWGAQHGAPDSRVADWTVAGGVYGELSTS
jgi:Transposase IS116/IS110/IS902 family